MYMYIYIYIYIYIYFFPGVGRPREPQGGGCPATFQQLYY